MSRSPAFLRYMQRLRLFRKLELPVVTVTAGPRGELVVTATLAAGITLLLKGSARAAGANSVPVYAEDLLTGGLLATLELAIGETRDMFEHNARLDAREKRAERWN